jgi:hypothetical protein
MSTYNILIILIVKKLKKNMKNKIIFINELKILNKIKE